MIDLKSRDGEIRTHGLLHAKKKRWVGRVMLPADPVTRQRKSVRRFGLTEADVRKKLLKLINTIEDDGPQAIPAERMTFAELAQEYAEKELIPAEYIGEKKVAGRRELAAPKDWLKALTAHFGKKRLNQITFAEIKAYKLILIRRPVGGKAPISAPPPPTQTDTSAAPATPGKQSSIAAVNRELEFFRTVLNYAVANGQLAQNPFRAGKHQPLIEKAAETKRERFPTLGEELALLQVCLGEGPRGRAHLRPILIVAADTGLRRNELLTLETNDLDFARRVINVRALHAKTNRPRAIPMTPHVAEESAPPAKPGA